MARQNPDDNKVVTMMNLNPTNIVDAMLIVSRTTFLSIVGQGKNREQQAVILAASLDIEESETVVEMLSDCCPETSAMLSAFYSLELDYALINLINTHPDEYQRALEIIAECCPNTHEILTYMFALATVTREAGNLDKPVRNYH
ncbi:hypothetical protein UA32_11780 [Photobacterium angustum]|uniref:Uncharacterized protein n=2 Tax=Photobacterium angustum TaxID=661 RepID=A0ABX5H183_PHOAN|nr:hypothetical protein UA32_11780 [Photobacterium angustum]PSX07097.1 hypothetical protein C0W27_16130 [Photobacterium angustum]